MEIVDLHGLPLVVSTHAANHYEVTLMQLSSDYCMIEAKPENLLGNRVYDSDKLDDELKQDGIKRVAPHKRNRVRSRKPDGRCCVAMNDAGWCSDSLPGFNGNVASCVKGNMTLRIYRLHAACNHRYLVNNFEIGSITNSGVLSVSREMEFSIC